MGLFSGIKKVFKKIGEGVKKVFKKVGKFIGKVLNSKLGKILMIAATVITAGAALYGAFTGAMAGVTQGATFMDKFLMGAKGFLKGGMAGFKAGTQAIGQAVTGNFGAAAETIGNVGNVAREAAGGMQAAQAAGNAAGAAADVPTAVDAQNVLAGEMPTASQAGVNTTAEGWQFQPGGTTAGQVNLGLGETAGSVGAGTTAGQVNLGAGTLAPGSTLGGNLTTVSSVGAAQPGFLTRLGTAVSSAVGTPTGFLVAGQMVSGYAQQQAAEQERKEAEKRRKNSIWNRPDLNPQDWIYRPVFNEEGA